MIKNIWIAIVAVVVIAGAALWYFTQAPTSFAISPEDQPISWSLPLPQDAASSTPRLTAQIASLSKLLGQGQYPDDDIQIGIANDYVLIGDGHSAYRAYERAIMASSTNALVYENLGGLFARLYATSTALRAYAKAVEIAPGQTLFQLSYLDYLAQVSPTSPETAVAFASAKTTLGATDTNILIAEAGWLAKIGSTTAAIADWREVERQEPGAAGAIEARIAQLLQKK
jgi:tetratricopeptide (TPR) repeat protein